MHNKQFVRYFHFIQIMAFLTCQTIHLSEVFQMGKIAYILRTVKKMDIVAAFNVVEETSKRCGKKKVIILCDIIWCGFRYGAGYTDYYDFYFDFADKRQRKTYITRGINNSLIRLLNDSEYRHIFGNKDEFNKIFKDFIGRNWLLMKETDIDEFIKWADGKELIIAKPKDKMCGYGIEKINIKNFESLKFLYHYLENKHFDIVEECLIQHDSLNIMYPESINTIRVITVLVNGISNIIAAYLRIGNGAHIDNFNSGGMMTRIDLITGKIMYEAVDQNNTVFHKHPITGTEIVDFQIPMWNECLELTKQAANRVPQVAYIGWDVAVTPIGPVLVEGNEFPGHHQHLPYYSPDDYGLLPQIKEILKIKKI